MHWVKNKVDGLKDLKITPINIPVGMKENYIGIFQEDLPNNLEEIETEV